MIWPCWTEVSIVYKREERGERREEREEWWQTSGVCEDCQWQIEVIFCAANNYVIRINILIIK